jgi:hypothetical protein
MFAPQIRGAKNAEWSETRGGHNAKDYHLTITASRCLAADHGSEKGPAK